MADFDALYWSTPLWWKESRRNMRCSNKAHAVGCSHVTWTRSQVLRAGLTFAENPSVGIVTALDVCPMRASFRQSYGEITE